MWQTMISDPALAREGAKVANDWAISEIQSVSPRLVPTAQISLLDPRDAAAETIRAASLGFKALGLPVDPPEGQPHYHEEAWEPLWAAAEEAGLVVAFHIGTGTRESVIHRGPGAMVMSYLETSYGGQRAVARMVSSGALDRHPTLKILVSEGGASWVPFLGDRMNEGYRQHGSFVRPTLSRMPKEIMYRQVYASFQHDVSAVEALTGMGYQNVMWGSDYPHVEGTFGHTQETLHELFDDVPASVRERITQGAFLDLFPHVGAPPKNSAVAA